MPAPVCTHRLSGRTAAQVRALAQLATDHDGVPPLREQALLDLSDPGAPVQHLTVADPPIGYAYIDLRSHATAELVVAPIARGRGLGRALLAAVRVTATQVRITQEPPAPGATPQGTIGGVRVWAHGNLPAAQALAAHAGLTVQRRLWQMARSLTVGAPEPRRPDGVTIRPFVVGQDDDAVVSVNARAFAHHPDQGRMTLADLRARQREPWFRPDDLLLAERDGRLQAFVWMKVEPGGDTGELYVLGVDPDAQGTGLGRMLTARGLCHLAERGMRRAVLYTDADNTAATHTYTAAGFATSRVDIQYG